MEACAGTTRHCIQFLPVLQGPPSGHPPGKYLAHPHLFKMLINLLLPMRHVVSPLVFSTLGAPSLRGSSEQDQRQENDPHVH